MAFVSMMMVFIIIIFAILGLLFITGLIFLIIGIINKHKPKYNGKKSPVVCIVVGSILLILPVMTIAITLIKGVSSSVSTMIKRIEYESVTDKWKNEWVTDDSAANDAIEQLLSAADSGDHELFKKTFTQSIQKSENFDNTINTFFNKYPVGLSKCTLDGGNVSSQSSYNYGHNVQTGSVDYNCILNGEWYYIYMKFCYDNTDSPDDVGVTSFYIENLEANALDIDDKDKYLECNIKTDKEVSARLIEGKAFIFEPYPDREISEEQMIEYIEKYNDLYHLSLEIGTPNVTKKYRNSTGIDCYYELSSENGEPRYAYICFEYSTGKFLDGYICSDTECFYDKKLFSSQ